MTANEMKAGFLIKFDNLFEFTAPSYDDAYISYLLTEAQLRVFLSRYNPLLNRSQTGFEFDEQRRRELQQLVLEVKIDCVAGGDIISGTINNYYIVARNENIGFAIGDIIYIDPSFIGTDGYAIITGLENSVIYIDRPLLASITSNDSVFISAPCGLAERSNDTHQNGHMVQIPKSTLYIIEEGVTLYTGQFGDDTYAELPYESRVKPVRHDEYQINIGNPYKAPYNKVVWRLDVGNPSFNPTHLDFYKRVELITPEGYAPRYYRIRYLSYPLNIVINETTPNNQVSSLLDASLHWEIIDEAVAIAQAAVRKEDYNIGRAEANISE